MLDTLLKTADLDPETTQTWASMGRPYFKHAGTVQADLLAFANQTGKNNGSPEHLTPSAMQNIRIACANGDSVTG